VVLLWRYRGGGRGAELRKVERAWAAVLLGVWPMEVLVRGLLGPGLTWGSSLPCHLCDVTGIVMGLALWTRRRWLVELGFFWGLAAVLPAMVTPALQEAYPHPLFFVFFVQHVGVPVAAAQLVWGQGMGIGRWGWLRAWGMLWCYLVVVSGTNLLLRANYGFVCHKPPSPSPYDGLGDWPWYIWQLAAVSLGVFVVLGWLGRLGGGRLGVEEIMSPGGRGLG